MYDSTRRVLCRLLFLLLCVLPTLAVAGWVSVICSPSYIAARKTAWENTLTQCLGLSVRLQAVENPSRGVTVLEGLVLNDPETDAPVARVRQVEIGYRGDELVVLAAQPELHSEEVWRFCEALHERVLRSPAASQTKVHFYAGEMTIKLTGDRGGSTLTDVHCRLTPSETGPQATIEFCDVALQMPEPAQVRITRNRQVSPPATRWELNTRSTPLPCYLLEDHVPILASLGNLSTFQGTVEARQGADGWEGELTGRFRDVDLDRIVTERFNHKLAGSAEIVFRRARFCGGRLMDASGDVLCNGGVVSMSLLHEADKSLRLAANQSVRSEETDSHRPYQELKFRFTLDRRGLQVVGLCHGFGQGVVMADHFGPLLNDRPQEVIHVAAIARTFSSRSGEYIPATYEAQQLIHWLPPPSTTDAPVVGARQPYHSPVHLKRLEPVE